MGDAKRGCHTGKGCVNVPLHDLRILTGKSSYFPFHFNTFQTSRLIWFGIRGAEVQILLPGN